MKVKFVYLSLLLFGQSLIAQTYNPFSTSNQLIEDAVKNSFVVIHQRYQLQDSAGAFYGADGKDYFGESYSLAVKTQEGYLIDNSALYPWKTDSRFEPYNGSEEYKPVLSESKYRQWNDSVYTDQFAAFKTNEAEIILENASYFMPGSQFGNEGLSVKELADKNEGWLVCVVAGQALLSDSVAKLSLVVYRWEMKTEADKSVYEINPKVPSGKTVVGGIYVLPEVTGIGVLSFRLLATLHSASGEKWQLLPVVNETVEEATVSDKKNCNKQVVKPTLIEKNSN
ncbi:MAG: hypothetical protein LBS25_10470 [Candidatus Symbiothrix sp.]|nr:hypothetical protein [Candidatus Symbiothrix sp.]